ncbi:Uncharacterised protein [Mycobacteroides abscessus]|nr:Uncharacterised protein [Mycobacteroides abscessus]
MSSSRRALQASNWSRMSSQMRDTVDFDTAAVSPSASVKVACTSRVDSPRTNPAITSDSSALVLVTPLPNNWEAKRSAVPRTFGRSSVTGPAVVFTVVGQYPLRIPARAPALPAARS